MSLIGRLRKLRHFMGPATLDGPPVFLNSMPKAGTNLVELFLVELSYEGHSMRCLNESNIHRYTKNAGLIDLFSELPAETATSIRARVAQAESVTLTSAGAGE